MSKYVVVETTMTWNRPELAGVGVIDGESKARKLEAQIGLFKPLSQHETLKEARAVAETIAAFKNLPIRTWSL